MNNYTRSGLAGTKTEQNLMEAARSEALAHTKYMLYSEMASEAGEREAAQTFENFANNEKEHAELWLGYLGELGETDDNINSAVTGETFESSNFYPEASRIAAEEGFTELAEKFRMAGTVEGHHAEAYRKLSDDMAKGTMHTGNADTEWVCSNCGYHTKGNIPPEYCPLCSYPNSYFVKTRNY